MMVMDIFTHFIDNWWLNKDYKVGSLATGKIRTITRENNKCYTASITTNYMWIEINYSDK
jgi:hypothetical protein